MPEQETHLLWDDASALSCFDQIAIGISATITIHRALGSLAPLSAIGLPDSADG
jgi:hypothetical protein